MLLEGAVSLSRLDTRGSSEKPSPDQMCEKSARYPAVKMGSVTKLDIPPPNCAAAGNRPAPHLARAY